MPWLPLRQFRDNAVPKLDNLRRAAAAGLRVPPTSWLPAAVAVQESAGAPPPGLTEPLILRSGSPTEDTRTTSNAGQLLSLVVHRREELRPFVVSAALAVMLHLVARRHLLARHLPHTSASPSGTDCRARGQTQTPPGAPRAREASRPPVQAIKSPVVFIPRG